MRLLCILLSLVLSGAAAATPPTVELPAVVVVDQFAALVDQAGRSRVNVKLAPGIYRLDDPSP